MAVLVTLEGVPSVGRSLVADSTTAMASAQGLARRKIDFGANQSAQMPESPTHSSLLLFSRFKFCLGSYAAPFWVIVSHTTPGRATRQAAFGVSDAVPSQHFSGHLVAFKPQNNDGAESAEQNIRRLATGTNKNTMADNL